MSLPIPGILMITEAQVLQAMNDLAKKIPEGIGVYQSYGKPGYRCFAGAVLEHLGLPVPDDSEDLRTAILPKGSLSSAQYGFTSRAEWILDRLIVQNDEGRRWEDIIETITLDLREGRCEMDRPR